MRNDRTEPLVSKVTDVITQRTETFVSTNAEDTTV